MIATVFATERLDASPLRASDADEMVHVLANTSLYEFIGGSPPTLDELRIRYELLVAGNPDGDSEWMNWVLRRRGDGQPVGTVQAEVVGEKRVVARIAWVIGMEYQHRGFATEAATALVGWLGAQGIEEVRANIHPRHSASIRVAERAGLVETDESHSGETVWHRALDPASN